MDLPYVVSVELLRNVYGADHVRTGTPVTAAELTSLERELGVVLPEDYKQLVTAWGYWCAGSAANIVVYGIAAAEHGCPGEVDIRRARSDDGVPLLRVAHGDDTRVFGLDARGELRVLGGATAASFEACLVQAIQGALEAHMAAVADAVDVEPEPDDEPAAGQANLQMHAVPAAVVAALKKEPGVADEITLYTSVSEFREQTVAWEKTQRDTDAAESKEMVRRMRSLLKQPGVAKLKELVGDSVDLFRWPDAIVACFGEDATESLALRGSTKLPSDGTDTISMLSIAEVKRVAAALADSEQRLRAGYRPDVLRARGLYNTDAPNEAAYLEELAAMWSDVAVGITDAAAAGGGWIIRRSEG